MAAYSRNWMWSEACEMLTRAERLHHEFFRPARSASGLPTWEPPVDVLETEREVLVLMALPGVDPERVEALIDGTDLAAAESCRPSCELRSFTASSCRRAVSSDGCACHPVVMPTCGGLW